MANDETNAGSKGLHFVIRSYQKVPLRGDRYANWENEFNQRDISTSALTTAITRRQHLSGDSLWL
jgi:hypothetical protein